VMTAVLKDDTELFKQFSDNESFRRWLTDTVFELTYEWAGAVNLATTSRRTPCDRLRRRLLTTKSAKRHGREQ